MFGVHSGVAFHAPVLSHGAASVPGPRTRARQLAQLATGRRRGPITGLITPWSLGRQTRPFVSMEYIEASAGLQTVNGPRPESRTATLVAVLAGRVLFEQSNGTRGEVGAGACAWMPAPHVTWRGESGLEQPLRVFQLAIAPIANQLTAAGVNDGVSQYYPEESGPVRVLLGRLGRISPRPGTFADDVTLFHVSLKDNEVWSYAAPAGHNVTWLAVERGSLELNEGQWVYWEQIGVFDESAGLIELRAAGDTSFLLGSARQDPR